MGDGVGADIWTVRSAPKLCCVAFGRILLQPKPLLATWHDHAAHPLPSCQYIGIVRSSISDGRIMNFWLYTVIMFCILSSVDLAKAVVSNPNEYLPGNREALQRFYWITFPAIIGSIAVPIYGFFTMAWWQPILGFVLAVFLELHLTKRPLAQSIWLNRWAIRYSVLAAVLFAIAVFV